MRAEWKARAPRSTPGYRRNAGQAYPERDWPRRILFFPSLSEDVLKALASEPVHGQSGTIAAPLRKGT